MASIEHRPRTPPAARTRLATIDGLQALFLIRLQSERMHFASLSAALAQAEDCPGGIFDDLNFRAHRLKGAAATFGFAALADAAGALERASFAAANSQAMHGDSSVWEALVGIVQLLGAFGESTLERPAAVPAPAAP